MLPSSNSWPQAVRTYVPVYVHVVGVTVRFSLRVISIHTSQVFSHIINTQIHRLKITTRLLPWSHIKYHRKRICTNRHRHICTRKLKLQIHYKIKTFCVPTYGRGVHLGAWAQLAGEQQQKAYIQYILSSKSGKK